MGDINARKNFAPPLFFGAQKHFQIVKERLKTFVSDQGRASFLCEAKQKIEKKNLEVSGHAPMRNPSVSACHSVLLNDLGLFGFTSMVDPEQGSCWSIFEGQINSRFEISAYSV